MVSAPTQLSKSQNLLSRERVERQDFVNLEEGGSEWVWDQRVGVGVWVRRLVPIFTIVQYSGAVRLGVEWCVVFERWVTRAGPTAGQPSVTIRSSLSLGQHR